MRDNTANDDDAAIYVGRVTHRRLTPKRHALNHRVYWVYLNLDRLEQISAKLRTFSINRTNLFSLYETDHGDGSRTPLRTQARQVLNNAGIDATHMTIHLLCMPRVMGYDFNPLSVYYCRSHDGVLVAMIYEVNNTFGGRHSYVIPVSPASASKSTSSTIAQACAKTFYVSPFMDMELQYEFETAIPDDEVRLAIRAGKGGKPIIHTALHGKRRFLIDRNLLQVAVTHPLIAHKVTGAIYWHGLKMWLKGFAVNPTKPSRAKSTSIVQPEK